MKYKSSLTGQTKVAIIILLLFWLVNFLAIRSSNGVQDAIVFSIFMGVFATVFISALVRGIYITIENNSVKYVHMFILRRTLEIGKINKIQKGLSGGMYKSLMLIQEENGKIYSLKIVALTFKKETLKQFVSDLIRLNQQIVTDKSVEELIG